MKGIIAAAKVFIRGMDKERRAAARALPKRERRAAEHCARAMTAWEMARAENRFGGGEKAEAALAVEGFCLVIGAKFTSERSV